MSKLNVAEVSSETIIQLHLHSSTNVFGMQDTNMKPGNGFIYTRAKDGIKVTSSNPKLKGQFQEIPWANIKTIIGRES